MQMQRANAHTIDIYSRSALLDNFAPPHFTLQWDWALQEIEKGLEEGRTDTLPNGGYVVNEMKPTQYILDQARRYLQIRNQNKIVRIQMYAAVTRHAAMFGEHTDPGQRSLVLQGQGRSAVAVGDQYAILEPGDIMFLNGDEKHRFTSLGPRFSITVSLEDE